MNAFCITLSGLSVWLSVYPAAIYLFIFPINSMVQCTVSAWLNGQVMLFFVAGWMMASYFFFFFVEKSRLCMNAVACFIYFFLRPIYTRDNRWWWWKISGAYTIYVSGMNRSDIFFFFVFPFFFSNKPKWIFKKMWIVYCRYHQSFH